MHIFVGKRLNKANAKIQKKSDMEKIFLMIICELAGL